MKTCRTLPLLAALLAVGCSERLALDNPNLPGLQQLAASVDQGRLMARVQELASAHLAEAPMDYTHFNWGEPFRHLTRDGARAQVRLELEGLGYQVSSIDSGEGPLATSALVAEKRGATRPGEVVLVGAHYDAFYQGADDNSSGVAALLELARLFASGTFDRTVRFVAFDLEELGLVGSSRYVLDLAAEEQIVMALVFDCIGYAKSTPGSQLSLPGLPTPPAGDFLAVIANQLSLPRALEVNALQEALTLVDVVTLTAPEDGAFPISGNLMRSDHAPFWLTGRSALFMTDTANFRNPHYHKDTDTPDKLDPVFLRSVTQLAAVSLAYWAGGPR